MLAAQNMTISVGRHNLARKVFLLSVPKATSLAVAVPLSTLQATAPCRQQVPRITPAALHAVN